MPFNIDGFRSNELIGKGFLRTNQFMMRIPIPPGMALTGSQTITQRNIEFICDSTNFPMTGEELHGVRRYGYGVIERKPVFPIFSNLQCTFLCDKDADVQDFFHEWQRIIVNYSMGQTGTIENVTNQVSNLPMYVYELGYKVDYMVDMTLRMFSVDGEIAREVVFREAYPIVAPDIRLGWGQLNDIVRIPVMFTFMDWYDNSPTSV